jgi:exodeoxyribonuclease VII small subunit
MAKKSDIKNYDEAVKELEEILQLLENNELKIDDLTQKAKRATVLVEYCKEKLRKTTEELDEIMKS